MKTLFLALLLSSAAVVHADDPCTIDFVTLYCSPLLVITNNPDGTQTIDPVSFDDYQACAAWVSGMVGN